MQQTLGMWIRLQAGILGCLCRARAWAGCSLSRYPMVLSCLDKLSSCLSRDSFILFVLRKVEKEWKSIKYELWNFGKRLTRSTGQGKEGKGEGKVNPALVLFIHPEILGKEGKFTAWETRLPHPALSPKPGDLSWWILECWTAFYICVFP